MEIKTFSGFGEVSSSTPCGRVADILDRLSPVERITPFLPNTRGGFDVMTPYSVTAESADKCVVKLDLPGVAAADLKVEANGHVLKVEALRKAPEGFADKGICNVMYQATVRMPEYVAANKFNTSFENGVLTIEGSIDKAGFKAVNVKK